MAKVNLIISIVIEKSQSLQTMAIPTEWKKETAWTTYHILSFILIELARNLMLT